MSSLRLETKLTNVLFLFCFDCLIVFSSLEPMPILIFLARPSRDYRFFFPIHILYACADYSFVSIGYRLNS